MGGKRTEYCGRCAMSSVVDISASEKEDADRERSDPFRGARIEVGDRELRLASPGAWLSGLRTRLDEAATRLTYGRSG
jgi:hypothetical protein